MRKTYVALATLIWLTGSSLLLAQQPVTKGSSVTATATIQAIDKANRRVTLRNEKGEEDTVTVGPEVKRFDELKVGDVVRMTYYESMVFQVRKPGDKPTGTTGDAALTRSTGAPGATLAAQETRTVTVKAIDPAVPSVTVTTEDGRTVTRKIDNKKNLEGLKVGDRIDITYTQALVTEVVPAK